MNRYEAVFIARQDLATKNVDDMMKKISTIVKDNGGETVSTEYWGLRDLSHKINKCSKGHYILLNISSTPKIIVDINHFAKFSEDVIRHTIFKVEEFPENPSQLALADTAGNYSSGKIIEQKEDPLDEIIENIVINNG